MKKTNLWITFILFFIFVVCAYAKKFHEDVIIDAGLTVTGTIVDPTINNFTNSTHTHEDAASGGQLDFASAATVLLTQPFNNFNDSFGAGGSEDGAGQQILIGDDPITVESLGFKVFDDLSSGGTFTFQVRNCDVQNNNCGPASIVATSVATLASTLGASLPSNFVTINMITPAVLSANTWYAVVVDASSITTEIRVPRSSSDIQPLVNGVLHVTGGGWGTFANDFTFELNGTTGSANSYLSNLNDVAINVPLEFGFLIDGVVRTQDNSVLNGDSKPITIETGLATGGGTANRGPINIDAPIVNFTDFASFKLDDGFSSFFNSDIPSLVFDGTSTEALAAFGTGIIFDGNGDEGFLLIGTKEILSGTAPSSSMNFFIGPNAGTGDVGDMEFFIEAQTGSSGDVGKFLFFSKSSSNGAQGGFEVRTSAGGFINFRHQDSIGTIGECWVSTGTLGQGNWDTCPGGGPAPSFLSTDSSTKTGITAGHWMNMTGNSINLPVGSWVLHGFLNFKNNGSAPSYTRVRAKWADIDGADSTTEPTSINNSANVVVDSGMSVVAGEGLHLDASSPSNINIPMGTIRVTVSTSATDVFLVPSVNATTMANVRVEIHIYAEERK